jgi:hypothetical protein
MLIAMTLAPVTVIVRRMMAHGWLSYFGYPQR